MIMRVKWRHGSPTDKPQMIVVDTAWPNGSWICYRKPGEGGVTHMIPESAVWEVLLEEQAGDPDPMRKRAAEPANALPTRRTPAPYNDLQVRMPDPK